MNLLATSNHYRKTAVIDCNGHRTETKYNLRGEAISVTNANGNQTCLIDANALSNVGAPGHQPLNAQGCTETRVYDELNRLTQTKDAQGNITAISYDLLGNPKTITDAEGRTTTFKYDDLGRLIETVDPVIETPVDKTQLFVYDEAGNLIEATDRKGQVTRYTYDRLNRNTQTLHLVDNSTESNTYDSFGDLAQSQNSAVTYTYTYTAKHQLKSKTDYQSDATKQRAVHRSRDQRGVAIFAKAFLGIPAQQAAKITRPLMPSAAPAVLLHSLHTQQGVCNIVTQ
jgi:YD repeat-containing protein